MKDHVMGIICSFKNSITWIFSGVGVLVLSVIIARVLPDRKVKQNTRQSLKKKYDGIFHAERDVVNLNFINSTDEITEYVKSKNLNSIPDVRNNDSPNDMRTAIVSLIMDSEGISVKEISRKLGISEKMVENLTKNIVSQGIVDKSKDLLYISAKEREL